MTIRYVHLILALAVVGTWACGGAESVLESNEEGGVVVPLIQRTRQPFVGAWALKTIERRNVEGELVEPLTEGQVGYLIYDETGYMGVTRMRPTRPPPKGWLMEEASQRLRRHFRITVHTSPILGGLRSTKKKIWSRIILRAV